MKERVLLARLTSALAISTLCVATARAGILDLLRGEKQPPPPVYQRVAFVGSAEIKEVQGAAERLRGIDRWERVRKGERLAPGDLIRTHQGTVLLRMIESESFVKVTPRTVLRLAPLEDGWDRGVLSGQEQTQGFIVRGCRGNASFKTETGAWQPLAVNSVLPEGSVIRTDENATVSLFHSSRARAIRVQPNSTASLGGIAVATRSDSHAVSGSGGGR